MRWFPDHEVCGIAKSEIDMRVLGAWAGCIAFASDLASYDELMHAIEHFHLIRNAQFGYLGDIDSMCLGNVHEELAYRVGVAR